MKIKNMFLFIAFMATTQSAFAARLTVYNETQSVQDINVFASNNWRKAHRILPGQKVAVNSGFNAFTHVDWGSPINPNSNPPTYGVRYQELIPSSVTMLGGSLMLWDNGKYGINFDKNGASSNKVSARQGIRIK